MKCDFCNQEFPAEELETIKGALHDSGDPEVFRSGNCPGGDEYNARLIEKYSGRVRSL